MREERIAIRLECLKLACTKAVDLQGILATATKFEEHIFDKLPEEQKGDSTVLPEPAKAEPSKTPRPSSKSGNT